MIGPDVLKSLESCGLLVEGRHASRQVHSNLLAVQRFYLMSGFKDKHSNKSHIPR